MVHVQQLRQQRLLHVSSQEAVYSVQLLQALTPGEAKAVALELWQRHTFVTRNMRDKIRICHSVLADAGSTHQGSFLGPTFCPERSQQLHLIMQRYFAEQHVPAMRPELSATGPSKHSRPPPNPWCSPDGGSDTKAAPTADGAETGDGLSARCVVTGTSTNFAGLADRGAAEWGGSAIPVNAPSCHTDTQHQKQDDKAQHVGARILMNADCRCDSGPVATDTVLGKQSSPPDLADHQGNCGDTEDSNVGVSDGMFGHRSEKNEEEDALPNTDIDAIEQRYIAASAGLIPAAAGNRTWLDLVKEHGVHQYYLNFRGTLFVPQSEVAHLLTDLRQLLAKEGQQFDTPRQIARILHGLHSPKFPVESWGSHRLWGRYQDVEFDTILRISTTNLTAWQSTFADMMQPENW
uniref:Uncharacterized protein n=1 Tax=Eutreptiella gymnastica TaxID=73025 RepID=A0A7S1NID0_9EUGL